MKNRAIRNIAILGSVAIAGVISVQIYWINQALNLQQKQFQEGVFISLKRVAERISEYNLMDSPATKTVKQISSDYYIVNIREAIDANILELYLRDEFDKMNIQTDYEYAIYDCASEKMVYGAYVSFQEKETKIRAGNLPKYDEFIYYFGINFPKQTSYLIAGNQLWIFFSGLLFLTVIFFVHALNIILKQKRLSELQKEFINNMTHEFKTPISTILIASDALLDDEVVKNKKELSNYSQIIKEQNERLNRQVEKVLQITEMERADIELKKEKISLHESIKSIASSVEIKLTKQHGELTTSLAVDDDIVCCDKLHLTNIIYNVIDNALKYSNEKPKIRIETRQMERFLHLSITDNGIGIADEHIAEVKKKFYRVPTGKVHNVKGFGLGLYYVNQVCKAHDWHWEIESTVGEGTSIIFKIKK
ncbi:MAG: HAMP domain-containing sensor histidine kinase [Flavobacteriales bacterium]|nr:HAMP domain-containing sensor histidine kinase [Flavobacteriales bacterium]